MEKRNILRNMIHKAPDGRGGWFGDRFNEAKQKVGSLFGGVKQGVSNIVNKISSTYKEAKSAPSPLTLNPIIKKTLTFLGPQNKEYKPSKQEQTKLDILRKNVIDQTNYTSKAETRAKTIPLSIFKDHKSSNVASGYTANAFYMPQEAYKKQLLDNAESIFMKNRIKKNEPNDSYIKIGQDNLNISPTMPGDNVNTLRHELIHAMDANVNGPYNIPANSGRALLDSYGYKDFLAESRPGKNENVNEFLKGYQNLDSRGTDIESFANSGESEPMDDKYYSNVYNPGPKYLNSSPVYPSDDTLAMQSAGLPDWYYEFTSQVARDNEEKKKAALKKMLRYDNPYEYR